MQYAPEFASEFEEVEILQTNRRTGLGDVVASDVRMLIQPLPTTPQELSQVGRRADFERFGGILETPHDEIKKNRKIRRADGSELLIQRVLDALGEQQLELRSEGSP